MPSPPTPPDQGVATIEQWANLAALVTRAMNARADLAQVLAPLGLDPDRYWKAAEYWNARIAADLRLAQTFSEIMVRQTGNLMQGQAWAHAEAHRDPATGMGSGGSPGRGKGGV